LDVGVDLCSEVVILTDMSVEGDGELGFKHNDPLSALRTIHVRSRVGIGMSECRPERGR
jgi:hypothetical protein